MKCAISVRLKFAQKISKKNDLRLASHCFYYRFVVGRARFELATNGLKVRCSTDWATDPVNKDYSKKFIGLPGSAGVCLSALVVTSPLRIYASGHRWIFGKILLNSLQNRLRDPILVAIVIQTSLFLGVADKGGFYQDWGDIRSL